MSKLDTFYFSFVLLHFLLCENFGKYPKGGCIPMTKEQKEMIKMIAKANKSLSKSRTDYATTEVFCELLSKTDIQHAQVNPFAVPVTYCPLKQ